MTESSDALVTAATATELVTYDRGSLSASVEARASASAQASFELRRGVRAQAEAQAGAEFEAKLGAAPGGEQAQALVQAQVSASAKGVFAGQLDVHGLFAEVALGVEARARVRADLSLSAAALLDGLRDDLPPYLYRPAIALLRQTQLHAGVFAEVYLALKLQARLQAGGSLIPVSGAPAGFTVNFRYGYAYIYGCGVHGYVDFEFPDAGAVVDAVVAELVQELDELVPADAPPPVMLLLRLLLPLAGSAAVAVGRELGAPRMGAEPEPADLSSVAASFLRELRLHGLGQVLTTVVKSAAEDAARQLAASLSLNPRLISLGEQALTQASAIVHGLRSDASPAEALPPVVAVCGILADLGDGTATDPLGGLADACTVVGSGVSLLLSLLGQPIPPLPPPLAARVHARLDPPAVPGSAAPADITMLTLVEYLASASGVVGADGVHVLAELAQALGRTPEALIQWLWELGSDSADPADTRRLAETVIHSLTTRLADAVTPFLAGLPDGDFKQLTIFVRPLLEIVDLALPALITTGSDLTPTQAARLRDQLDTQLTQLFGSLTVRVLDRVIRPYFRRGPDQLRELAGRVDRSDPAFAEFFAVANQFSVLFRLDEAIVAAALRETADMLALVESSGFDSAIKLMDSFVLLPEDNADRRAQLAQLAGTDQARIGDAALWAQLLEAMFVDSHELALGMIPPSIRMSTLIVAEQGPIPMVTVFEDATRIGQAMIQAVDDLQRAGDDVATLISGLIEQGRLNAEALQRLSGDFKQLLRDLAEVVDAILRTIKDLLWPLFVLSTGGIGLLLQHQFDDFFNGATWIVDRVRDALGQLADEIVAIVVGVAQGAGVLDAGHDGDLGDLGRAIHQQALGQPGQVAVAIQLGPGTASVSRAELGSTAVAAVFARGDLRDRIRDLHDRAGNQVTLAARVDGLRSTQGATAARVADLQQQAAAKTLPTGTPLSVEITGLEAGQPVTQEHVFSLLLPAEHQALVTGGSTVRLEVGGMPVVIDDQLWHPDGHGNLQCHVSLVCEPPALSADDVPKQIGAIRAAERGVRAAAGPRASYIPSVFRPRDGTVAPSEPAPAEAFIPWSLSRDGLSVERLPTVVARHELAPVRAGAPHPPLRSISHFTSSARLAPPGPVVEEAARPVGQAPPRRDQEINPGEVFVSIGMQTAEAASSYAAVAVVPPGFCPITVCVSAVPGPGQDRDTTPGGIRSTWCIISPAPK